MIFAESGGGNALSLRSWDASAFEGDTVRLRIYDTHTGGWGHINVDDIAYRAVEITAIPEPSTFALAALGLLGMAWFGRRRKVSARESL